MSFRLNWAVRQFASRGGWAANRALLEAPWKFYYSLFAKLVPGLHRGVIALKLRTGQVIAIREFMSLFIYKEIFIDGCYDILDASSAAPFVIDIGANTGLFALRLKTTHPSARILSFEPYPPNHRALVETIQSNRLEGVDAIQKAIAAKVGRLKLFIHRRNVGGHSLFEELANDRFVEVETVTLASIFETYSIETCHLMKLDCEGAEYQILKSLTRGLAGRIQRIVYEPTSSRYAVAELNEHLLGLGYGIRMAQGLVIASYRSN